MSPKFADYPQHATAIIQAALDAAEPARLARAHWQRRGRTLIIGGEEVVLADGRLFVVSVGKAGAPLALAAAEIVGDLLYRGVGISKTYTGDWEKEMAARNVPPAVFPLYLGNHPVSGPESARATAAVAQMLAETRENDLVVCLISGGTSALLTQPRVSPAAWQALNRALLASGCSIEEFNAVRRQLDGVKGGGLARLAAPAPVVSLILSDVVGNRLPAIGSGPTVLTDESPADALAVLQRYGIEARVETAVWREIVSALGREREVTAAPPPRNLIIGDVGTAAVAAAAAARRLGFTAQILTTHLEGAARKAGRFAAALAQDAPPGRCLILGGETTVTLRGGGIGGRNLETALAAAITLAGRPRAALFSLATDGEDGPTGAAGALVTGETAARARVRDLNPRAYLDDNDSYTFFRELDETGPPTHLIVTGPTGTNVNDLICVLTYDQ